MLPLLTVLIQGEIGTRLNFLQASALLPASHFGY